MTPILFPLPAGRILPPTTAYAAGLICELRHDLADGVRSAVLGDAAATALDVLTLARVEAGDEQGANALAYLREIVHYGGNDPKALHGLADVLGLIPRRTAEMRITTPDTSDHNGDPAIGDVWYVKDVLGAHICGLAGESIKWSDAIDGGDLLIAYLRVGFDGVWSTCGNYPGGVVGEREALRRLIPLHAHTVSLDADVRAAWAKAHIDALTDPVRPMSPDRHT